MSVEEGVAGKGRRQMTPWESAFNIAVFVVFAVLWIGFAYALIVSQGSLDAAWQWIRGLPLILQGVVWLLFLPVVAGLWIWESGWTTTVRLLLVAGLGFANLYLFFPGYLLKR